MIPHFSIDIQRGSFEQGHYLLREGHPAAEPAKAFIEQRKFFDLQDAREIPLRNKSNKLYEIRLAGFDTPLYLKMIWCHPDFAWSRRLNYLVRQLFRDNAFKAFRGSLAMEAAGLETLRAVACWRWRREGLTRESYFLYEPLAAKGRVKDLYEDCKQHPGTEHCAAFDQALTQMAHYLRHLFQNNLRHHDLALGNWLVTGQGVALIDTDAVTKTRIPLPILKTFFDLACFKRLNLPSDDERRVLRQCLGEAYHEGWWKVHRFWRFGMWRRLRGKKRRSLR